MEADGGEVSRDPPFLFRKGAANGLRADSQCQGPDRHSLQGPGLEKPNRGRPCAESGGADLAPSAAPARCGRCCCRLSRNTRNRRRFATAEPIQLGPLGANDPAGPRSGLATAGKGGSVLAVGITGWLKLECLSAPHLGAAGRRRAVGIKAARSGLEPVCSVSLPGQQVPGNGCAAFGGHWPAATTPRRLVEQNGEAASRIGQRLVVDFDAI